MKPDEKRLQLNQFILPRAQADLFGMVEAAAPFGFRRGVAERVAPVGEAGFFMLSESWLCGIGFAAMHASTHA